MKITTNNPVTVEPPPVTYTLELTGPELSRVQTALYLMSRQEGREAPFTTGADEKSDAEGIYTFIFQETSIG